MAVVIFTSYIEPRTYWVSGSYPVLFDPILRLDVGLIRDDLALSKKPEVTSEDLKLNKGQAGLLYLVITSEIVE